MILILKIIFVITVPIIWFWIFWMLLIRMIFPKDLIKLAEKDDQETLKKWKEQNEQR